MDKKKTTKETRKEKKQEKLEISEAGSRPETPDQEGALRDKKKTTKDRKRYVLLL